MVNRAEKQAERSKAAYTLVDMSGLPKDVRDAILEDAAVGGGDYGVQVVEEHVNGAVRVPIYGVYDFNADKWAAAKDEFGIAAEEVDDAEVHPGPLNTSDEDEAKLRERAQETANALAEEARTAEASRLREITGEDPPVPVAEQDGSKGTSAKSSVNKAPR